MSEIGQKKAIKENNEGNGRSWQEDDRSDGAGEKKEA